MWRYRDEVRALRARVAAGELGRIVRTHGYGVHAGWGPSGWFTDPALAGGGALIDMGIHAIDTARYLLGDPEPVRVRASLGTSYGDYDVDDDGLVLIDWSDGVRSVVESGWWAPRLGGLEADTELYGSGGLRPDLAGHAAARATSTAPCRCTPRRWTTSCAASASPAHVPPAGAPDRTTGLRALEIVERAYASARERGVKLVLGVDAGGTTTDAIVCTPDGAVVGAGSAGCGSWEEVGLEAAVAAVLAATAAAGTAPRAHARGRPGAGGRRLAR